MTEVWRHIQHNYREGGLGRVLYKCIWRAGQWIWSDACWLVYAVKVSEYRRRPTLSLSNRTLDFEALYSLGYFKTLAFPEVIRSRLERGEQCHGFFLGETLVNIGWTTADYLELEPGYTITEEGWVGIYDCYTLPAWRSRGIYTDSLILLLNSIRERDCEKGFISVDPGNLPSIKGIEKASFRPLYRLRRFRRFGRVRIEKSEFDLRYGQKMISPI